MPNTDNEEVPWEDGSDQTEDDRTHLLGVLEEACNDLASFWMAAEPRLRRSGGREAVRAISSNYYRVYDGLRHSVEWLRAMPTRSSDGTRVWAEQPPKPAATNEVEGRSNRHGEQEGPEMAASGSRSGSWTGWAPGEEPPGEDWIAHSVRKGAVLSEVGAKTHSVREGEADKQRKAQRSEARRLAKLRAVSRKPKATRRRR